MSLILQYFKPIIVSKINLQWSCLPTFSYPPLQKQLKLKVSTENFKHINCMFGMLSSIVIIIIYGFTFVRINLVMIATIMAKHANIFC